MSQNSRAFAKAMTKAGESIAKVLKRCGALLADFGLAKTLGFALVLLIAWSILIETFRPVVRIEPFEMPHDYTDRGLTGDAFSNQIMDAIQAIKREAATLATAQQYSQSENDSQLADVEVPDTKISLRAIAQVLQGLLGLQPMRISGEVVEVPSSDNVDESSRKGISKLLCVTVRLVSGNNRAPKQFYIPTRDPHALVAATADEIVSLVDPYIAACRLHKEHFSQEALSLLNNCVGDQVKWGWILRGNILKEEHEYSRAQAAYENSLFSVSPDCRGRLLKRYKRVCALGYMDLGSLRAVQHDLDGAINYYNVAIGTDKSFAWAYSNLGIALSEEHKDALAIAKCKKAIDLDPKAARFHHDLGRVLHMQGNEDGAIQEYRTAIGIDPQFPLPYSFLGVALSEKGDSDKGIVECKKAIELDPKEPVYHYNLGKVFITKKDNDDAIVEYKKAIELDPKNESAKQTLATLHRGRLKK